MCFRKVEGEKTENNEINGMGRKQSRRVFVTTCFHLNKRCSMCSHI